MYLTLLNCTIKNGYDGRFYIMHILPQLKFFLKKGILKLSDQMKETNLKRLFTV